MNSTAVAHVAIGASPASASLAELITWLRDTSSATSGITVAFAWAAPSAFVLSHIPNELFSFFLSFFSFSFFVFFVLRKSFCIYSLCITSQNIKRQSCCMNKWLSGRKGKITRWLRESQTDIKATLMIQRMIMTAAILHVPRITKDRWADIIHSCHSSRYYS